MPVRASLVALALATLVLGVSPAAQAAPHRVFAPYSGAENQISSNWAGYVATGTNASGAPVSYTDVTSSWVQPKVSCARGEAYSAFWVGLGGFASTSTALEQIGTESNCDQLGRPVYDAWYEIVPAPSIPIRMKILPGDQISAAVLVQGTQVTLQITNLTRRSRVTRRVTVASPDLTSAEWIAEAPSECFESGRCDTLPLADFGSVAFLRVAATGDGAAGTLTNPTWSVTPIELSEQELGGPNQLLPQPTGTPSGAVPSALSADGRSFSVAWHPATA